MSGWARVPVGDDCGPVNEVAVLGDGGFEWHSLPGPMSREEADGWARARLGGPARSYRHRARNPCREEVPGATGDIRARMAVYCLACRCQELETLLGHALGRIERLERGREDR
jgi:hypothetical protein